MVEVAAARHASEQNLKATSARHLGTLASIANAVLATDLIGRITFLNPAAETIIHCKAGGRSAKALQILLDSGFSNACHVQGGINAWSREIDPTVPLY